MKVAKPTSFNELENIFFVGYIDTTHRPTWPSNNNIRVDRSSKCTNFIADIYHALYEAFRTGVVGGARVPELPTAAHTAEKVYWCC